MKGFLRKAACIGLLSPLALVFAGGKDATASSHSEAPAMLEDRSIDATDLWAWKDSPTTFTILSGWIPFGLPFGGPNYTRWNHDALYEIHIDTNGDGVEDITYQFQFKNLLKRDPSFLRITSQAPGTYPTITSADDANQNFRQTYTVTRVVGPRRTGTPSTVGQDLPVCPPNVGPKFTTNYAAIATSGIKTLSNAEQVYVGPRQDCFFIDLGPTFDKVTVRDLDNRFGTNGSVGQKGGGVNSIAGYNVDVIALQIPVASLGIAVGANTKIGVWCSCSKRKVTVLRGGQDSITSGQWVQLNRLGNPLVNELFIPFDKKDEWNTLSPKDDATFSKAYIEGTAQRPCEPALLIKALYGAAHPNLAAIPTTGRTDLSGLFVPDTLKVGVGTSHPVLTASGQAFFGANVLVGRTLADDVVDIYLEAAAGILSTPGNVFPNNALGDGCDWASSGITPIGTFPYMPLPISGTKGATSPYDPAAPATGTGVGFMVPTPQRP